jgi:hypothetical protein
MRSGSTLAAACAALAAVFLAGCSGGQKPGATGADGSYTQETPKGTLSKMFDAAERGDKEAFMACWKIPDGLEELTENTFAFNHAMFEFQEAMAAAYGRDAAGQADSAAGEAIDLDWRRQVEAASVDIEGDTAMVSLGEGLGSQPARLVRENALWYLDAAHAAPKSEAGRSALSRRMAAAAEAVSRVTARIGQGGETAESIRKQLTAAVAAAAGEEEGAAEEGGPAAPPAPDGP